MTPTNDTPTNDADAPHPDLRCERVGLLLSLEIDGRATPAQRAEIEEHLPGCAACRSARAADRAVRERLATPAHVPSGFADRVVVATAARQREIVSLNRFLMGTTAAAVLIAAGAVLFVRPATPTSPTGVTAAGVDTPRGHLGQALTTNLATLRSTTEKR